MRLVRVRLEEFRNYAELDFVPEPGLNVLVGRNAQGKSNLLEAIAMLGTGKSFRTARDGEAIRHGAKRGSVDGEAAIAAGEIRLLWRDRTPGTRDAQAVRRQRRCGRLRTLHRAHARRDVHPGRPRIGLRRPDPPARDDERRARATLADVLSQPRALREDRAAEECAASRRDRTRSRSAPRLQRRSRRVGHAAARRSRAFRHGTRGARIRGPRAVGPGGRARRRALRARRAARERRRARSRRRRGGLRRGARRAHGAEIARRVTLVGPHRDDIRTTLGHEGSLGAFGSQGQQRSAVLALKVGEYALVRDQSGEAPILLLDDVLSELDPVRAERFLAALGTVEQAFLTAVERPALAAGAARTYAVDDARVTAC